MEVSTMSLKAVTDMTSKRPNLGHPPFPYLNTRQLPDDRIVICHLLGAKCQDNCYKGRQPLRDHCNCHKSQGSKGSRTRNEHEQLQQRQLLNDKEALRRMTNMLNRLGQITLTSSHHDCVNNDS